MDDLQSEKEQIEEIKAWWSEYGKVIMAGLVIGVAGFIGWNQYSAGQIDDQTAASERFETLLGHVADGDMDSAEDVVDDLQANYAGTSYAPQAQLALAKLYMDQNRDQDAVDALQALLDMSADDAIQDIGRLRLAAILMYQEKADAAVTLLNDVEAAAFAAQKNVALGDAYAMLGDVDSAAEAYNNAIDDPSPSPTIDRAIVQMKLADLSELTVATADETAPEAADAPADEMDADNSDAGDSETEEGES